MKSIFTAIAASAALLAGCSVFQGADRYQLPPINVSGTSYEIFELVRSTNPDYDDPRNDHEATRAVYAVVGPDAVIYCGPIASGCEDAIRRFNNNEIPSETRVGM